MKRKLPLFVWLSGTIFPLNWLRQESSFLRRHFDHLFTPEWIHIIGHLVLFSILAILFLWTFSLPFNLKTVIFLLSILLIIGGVQEFFQLTIKRRSFGWPEAFDLWIDLVGGMMGVFLFGIHQRRKNSTNRGQH
jgi:glycopeptide antibiotics resistance protein